MKISGMIDESLDTKAMTNEPEPWEFRAKPAWQRLIVMLGGIIVNVVVGIIIFVAIAYQNGDSFLSKEEMNRYGIVAGPVSYTHLDVYKRQDWKGTIQIKVTNTTNQKLYFCAAYLSKKFQCFLDFLPQRVQLLEPGKSLLLGPNGKDRICLLYTSRCV